jgi:polyisoprenoid-binding protein YceI
MINLFKSGALALGLALLSVPAVSNAEVWDVDTSHSTLGFSVKHLMVSNTRGSFKKWSGTVDVDAKDPTKSKIDITADIASIDTDDAKRDEHLRAPDFFEAAKYPTLTFKSTKIVKAGKGYKVTGDLTIKDVTKSVTFNIEGPTKAVKDPWGGERMGLSVSGTINRDDFNVAKEQPGAVIGKDVVLSIDIELLKKKAA